MSKLFYPRDENFYLNSHDWDGYTLVIPCVSVGNVPQLSIDLIINSLLKNTEKNSGLNDLEFVGYLHSKHVRPFAGPDSFQMNGNLLSTSIQVFVSKSKKLVFIQQRSPIYKEFRENFYQEFLQWLSEHKFSLILILSSSFDHFLAPEFLDCSESIPIMYLSNQDHFDKSLKSFVEDKMKIKPVKPVDPYSMKPSEDGKIHLPGSGSARAFLKHFSSLNDHQTNILCLIMFCSEGDNLFHSFRMADKVADLLNRSTIIINGKLGNKTDGHQESSSDEDEFYQDRYPWIRPFSWRMMFGDEPPPEIY